ncbi:hypothetical protein CASFOL_027565 [Castilleja foliolosa]|uniref:Metallothionein n=1 Tax=Castilleja foliolosa TaxID=1961234 RepID=A0ABD3CGW4_9LAMI
MVPYHDFGSDEVDIKNCVCRCHEADARYEREELVACAHSANLCFCCASEIETL